MDLKTFIKQLKYSFYTILHPFDGFYEVKVRNHGGWKVATIFYILYGIVSVFSYQYTGFLVNFNIIEDMNSLYTIFVYVTPLLLYVVSNWSITTLFEGKGRLSEIYTVVGYALIPHIILTIVAVLISNIMTPDETAFYSVIISFGYIWFLILAFIGLIVIHEYTLFKNVITIFIGFLAMLFLTFIIILILMLSQQIYEFVTILFKELVIRLGG